MIRSVSDLRAFVAADAAARGIKPGFVSFIGDPIFRFNVLLRCNEYLFNRGIPSVFRIAAKFWFRRLSIRLGFSVPINVCGPGLAIVHYGFLVISPYARIGKNCRIHAGVNIGGAAGQFNADSAQSMAPHIGDRCYIAPGAKIFGPARIGNDCAVGANAVVNALVTTDGVTIAGIPAIVVSDRGSIGLIHGLP